ncbi:hypothetical protein CBR16_03240 [Cronobacter sakazakii]|nr:hypothetical protein CBR16_03240 [Cronobacter sakazakii]
MSLAGLPRQRCGFLRFPAVSCGFLRFPAVSCGAALAHQWRVLRSQNAGAVATGEFLSVIFSCGLRSAVCGLRSAVCGLRSAVQDI